MNKVHIPTLRECKITAIVGAGTLVPENKIPLYGYFYNATKVATPKSFSYFTLSNAELALAVGSRALHSYLKASLLLRAKSRMLRTIL